MRLADVAWREVDAATIQHCWRKAGILPNTDSPSESANPIIPISSLLDSTTQDPLALAESKVESALDELMSTGALQPKNRMDLEHLLNPIDESQVIEETSDEEICKAVLDARKAREALAINGGDDIDDDDASGDVCPTSQEVLRAGAVIKRYVDGLDSAFARELEATLAILGRQIRLEESHKLTPTYIPNYFSRAEK